jgi:hypothetical protein
MNPLLIGVWHGTHSTVPGYRPENDLVRIHADGTIEHHTLGPKGEKWRFDFRSESDGNEFTIYPTVGGTESFRKDGMKLKIELIDLDHFKILRVGHETTYRRKNEPNKALEPIPVNVTVPADAGTAPFTSMAHL